MKKTALSFIAILTLGSVASNATTLYQDENGQVFTQAGANRSVIKSDTPIFAKASKLKFSGVTYIGYVYDDYKSDTKTVNYKKDTSDFEIRRAYLQLKAYLLNDPKSYFRVTYDVHNDNGSMDVRAKYAYLYLNNIYQNTGVEIGLAHRPWHDYEEHNAWLYRSVSKILIEDKKSGPDLSNSADFGVMFKTRTQYFDADYGIFRGEGYHSSGNNGTGLSFEWRATAHILGTSSHHHPEKHTYWDASFYGQYNKDHKTVKVGNINETQDLIFGGLHTVYNQPNFLVSAQYVYSKDTSDIAKTISKQAGSGYSVNGEYRLGSVKEYSVLARYDTWKPKATDKKNKSYILGSAWTMNANVSWVANVIVTDNEAGSAKEKENGTQYMVTAEVKF
jgi:hypothetical protein